MRKSAIRNLPSFAVLAILLGACADDGSDDAGAYPGRTPTPVQFAKSYGGDSRDDVANASREPIIIQHEPPYEITENRTSDQHLLPDPKRNAPSDNDT